MLTGRRDAPAVYSYDPVPGVPPVGVARLSPELISSELSHPRAHTHDFFVLAFFERGGGPMWLGQREWQVDGGDAYAIAPGEVVGVPDGDRWLEQAEGWCVYFTSELLASRAPGTVLSWRAHPLLFPFVRGAAGGAQRLKVPPADQQSWSAHFRAVDLELIREHDGYQEAVRAHVTLLLVDASRLTVAAEGERRFTSEPVVAAVFDFIEARYADRISLKDVARAVSVSPGHLTTVVRRQTGRTVQAWIAERRMAEARRLLVETDLAVEEIGRQVGYGDPGYFMRSFRRAHGTTPLGWRRAARP